MIMSSLLRFFSAATRLAVPLRTRKYTPKIPQESREKWGLGAIPAPRSILEDDDTIIDLSEDNEAVNGARPNTPPIHARSPPKKDTPVDWVAHRTVLKKKFPGGWAPPRKLSREAMEGLRRMYKLDPATYTTPFLAGNFGISPEAVRRILKSKWEPTREKRIKLAKRERTQRQEALRTIRMRERAEALQLMELKKSLRGPDKLALE